MPPLQWPCLSFHMFLLPPSSACLCLIPRPLSPELTSPCSAQLWDRDEGGSAQSLVSGCSGRGRGCSGGGGRGTVVGGGVAGNSSEMSLAQALTSCVLLSEPWNLPQPIHHRGIPSDPGPLPEAWGRAEGGRGLTVSVAETPQLAALQACSVSEQDSRGGRRL